MIRINEDPMGLYFQESNTKIDGYSSEQIVLDIQNHRNTMFDINVFYDTK